MSEELSHKTISEVKLAVESEVLEHFIETMAPQVESIICDGVSRHGLMFDDEVIPEIVNVTLLNVLPLLLGQAILDHPENLNRGLSYKGTVFESCQSVVKRFIENTK